MRRGLTTTVLWSLMAALVAFAPVVAADECAPTAPSDDVTKFASSTTAAATLASNGSLVFTNQSAENATQAAQKILAALPGAILIPLDNVGAIIAASAQWGVIVIVATFDVLDAAILFVHDVAAEKIQESTHCLFWALGQV